MATALEFQPYKEYVKLPSTTSDRIEIRLTRDIVRFRLDSLGFAYLRHLEYCHSSFYCLGCWLFDGKGFSRLATITGDVCDEGAEKDEQKSTDGSTNNNVIQRVKL